METAALTQRLETELEIKERGGVKDVENFSKKKCASAEQKGLDVP